MKTSLKNTTFNNNIFKIIVIIIHTVAFTACNNIQEKALLENNQFKLAIDQEGNLYELLDKKTGNNLLIPDYKVSLFTIEHDGNQYPITKWVQKDDVLHLKFDEINADIRVKVESKSDYLTFEIIEVNSDKNIDKVILGPYQVKPSEKIGQSIGIAYNDTIAAGLMGLNLKSRGGYEVVARQRFGNTAKRIEDGASLTAFVRNRSLNRVVDNYVQKLGQAVPLKDSDAEIKGAKYALYCTPTSELKKVIKNIIQNENLPFIKTKGVWNKESNYSTSSKFIMPFNINNIDDCIKVAKKAGITCIYHGGIFTTWGNFEVNKEAFPNGYQSVRVCSDKAEKHGINLGAHTLTNFITTNDSFVTPTPHPDLVLAGITKLQKSISAIETDIELTNEHVRPAYHEPDLHKVNPRWREHTAVRIGDEIIEYTYTTANGKLILKDCKRGAFGTTPTEHHKGDQVGRLISHGYKVFFPNINLQDQMAKNLAKFFNEAHLKRISFDGCEGGQITGHGSYGTDRFMKVFFDHLNDKNIVVNSSDVTHYGWHYLSNESWGEPWESKNFREPHLEHRIQVQQELKEDLLPRKMGQFRVDENTTKRDIEWLMGLCTGFNAGVDFYISPDFETINKESDAILSEIKRWEEARYKNIFTEEQRTVLRDPYSVYGFEKDENGARLIFVESWKPKNKETVVDEKTNTLPEHILKGTMEAPVSKDYKHTNMTTEPGQPTASIWKYVQSGSEGKLQFAIRLPEASSKTAEGIYLKVGTQKVTIPFKLQPGEYIVNTGSTTYTHYSENNAIKNKVNIDNGNFTVKEGENVIEFDYKGEDRVTGPEIIVNFRVKP
ncbi:hypothetical protein [Aestuariibaculum sediminum]|uniref:Uncharacterized protein n=1 Tax=Aestuariibaculum sediminum TaxID=2770637 RepID=A0A8J6Q221_9FLAO|nr:hypothetical protein [Aestuariibaculum sediminum]MBD0831581.1 hypothetical protein [Aestuariibaculum sediminum]